MGKPPKNRPVGMVVMLPEDVSLEVWRKRVVELLGIRNANRGKPVLDVFTLYDGDFREQIRGKFKDKYFSFLFFSLFWGPYLANTISLLFLYLPIIIYVLGFLPFFLISIVLMVKSYG